jgi:hypothetical protein
MSRRRNAIRKNPGREKDKAIEGIRSALAKIAPPRDNGESPPPIRRGWLAVGLILFLLCGAVIAVPDLRHAVVGWFVGGDRDKGSPPRRENRKVAERNANVRQVDRDEFEELILRGAGRVTRPADLRSPGENRIAVGKSAEGKLCLQFIDEINAGKAPPAERLGPRPSVPDDPVTPEDAARLDAEFILRRSYRVEDVRPYPAGPNGEPRFLLVLKGGVDSEKMRVRTGEGQIEEGKRILSNPDVIVEVRDGKIYGIKAQVHTW